ncbi:MAG: shikimate dehydrogenase [Oscillospiraceae bacterium]|nr:shikimate dehydrogenase [Oscillospiraceae bacterium]
MAYIMKYVLTGYPLAHSASRAVHSALFKLSGKSNSNYSLFEIPPENFEKEAEELFKFDGFNVTAPFKTQIIKHLDRLEGAAERCIAVNTVKCDGKTRIGYNTDATGFTRSIKKMGTDLTGSVVILGCGGAGRMMAFETVFDGGKVTLAVREEDKKTANRLAAEIKQLKPGSQIVVADIKTLCGGWDLMVNATGAGMYPDVSSCPVALDSLEGTRYVFDAIYNPIETKLICAAKKAGAKTRSGLGMLVWQAEDAHKIWYGAKFNNNDIENMIKEAERNGGKFE